MQVQELECQIAQAQTGRYLSGESLSDETIADLERHLAQCEQCRGAIAERRRSLELLMVGPRSEAVTPAKKSATFRLDRAVVEIPNQDRVPAAFTSRASTGVPDINLGAESELMAPATFLKRNAKTLAYSIALAGVLVAISFLIKDPTKLFGERVVDSKIHSAASAIPVPPIESSEEAAAPNPAITTDSPAIDFGLLTNVDAMSSPPDESGLDRQTFALATELSLAALRPNANSPIQPQLARPRSSARPAKRFAKPRNGSLKRDTVQKRPEIRVYSPAGKPISRTVGGH